MPEKTKLMLLSPVGLGLSLSTLKKLLVIHHTAKSKVQIISQVLLAHTAQKVCKVSMLMRTYPVGMKPVRVLLMPSDQTITTISMDFSTVAGVIIYNSLQFVNY